MGDARAERGDLVRAHVEIPLSRGMVSLIDVEDYEAVTAAGKWYANPSCRTFYARRKRLVGKGKWIATTIHTLITGWPLVDHRNGDGLDNRRANLRPATVTQNGMSRRRRIDNTTGYKGVIYRKDRSYWTAAVSVRGRSQHLGCFSTPADAARAYDVAARAAYGEFARLNFPEEPAA